MRRTAIYLLGARHWINHNLSKASRLGVFKLDPADQHYVRDLCRLTEVSKNQLRDWGEEARVHGVINSEEQGRIVAWISLGGALAQVLPDWSSEWDLVDGTVPHASTDRQTRSMSWPTSEDGSSVVDCVIMIGLSLDLGRTQLDQTATIAEDITTPALLYRMIMMSKWHDFDQGQRDKLRDLLVKGMKEHLNEVTLPGALFRRYLATCASGFTQLEWTEGTKYQCGETELSEVYDIGQQHFVFIHEDAMKYSENMGQYLTESYFHIRRNTNLGRRAHCAAGKSIEDCDGDHLFGHYLLDRIPPVLIILFSDDYLVDWAEASARKYFTDWMMPASMQENASTLLFTPVMAVEISSDNKTLFLYQDINEAIDNLTTYDVNARVTSIVYRAVQVMDEESAVVGAGHLGDD